MHRQTKMSWEHFFVHGGVKNRSGLIHKIIWVGKVYLLMFSKTGLKAPAHNLVVGKKIEKLPKNPKVCTRDLGSNRGSTNLGKCKSITALDSWAKFFNHPMKDVSHNHWKAMKIFTQSVLCSDRENLCSCFWTDFFLFKKNMWLLLTIFHVFKERATASEKKICAAVFEHFLWWRKCGTAS